MHFSASLTRFYDKFKPGSLCNRDKNIYRLKSSCIKIFLCSPSLIDSANLIEIFRPTSPGCCIMWHSLFKSAHQGDFTCSLRAWKASGWIVKD